MEEKLIVAVCEHPELYDTANYWYRDRSKKDLAWRRVSEAVGEAEDVCREKWKGLMDTYLKERRKSPEKQSGSAAGTSKGWKYSAVMSFLDPFITPRETSSNMVRGVEEGLSAECGEPSPNREENTEGEVEGEETMDATVVEAEAGGVGPDAAGPSGTRTSGKRGKKRSRPEPIDMELAILEAIRRPPLSQDELFFKSLLPSMERVAPHNRDQLRIKMYRLIVEHQDPCN